VTDRYTSEAAVELDRAIAATPPSLVWTTGQTLAWTRRLELAYADGNPDAVLGLFDVMAATDAQVGGPDVPEPIYRWPIAVEHALLGFQRLLEVTQKSKNRTTRRQIAAGAAGLLRRCGPPEFEADVVAQAAGVHAGTHLLTPRPGEGTPQLTVVLACASSGWLVNQLFPAREMARRFFEKEIGEAEQLALRVPVVEWGGEATDDEAIQLLAQLPGWTTRPVPPKNPAHRNLLELDLIAVTKTHLEHHPSPTAEQRHALARRLDALITTYLTAAQAVRSTARATSGEGYTTPRPGQRPKRNGKR
jgi:hypothetical protein